MSLNTFFYAYKCAESASGGEAGDIDDIQLPFCHPLNASLQYFFTAEQFIHLFFFSLFKLNCIPVLNTDLRFMVSLYDN